MYKSPGNPTKLSFEKRVIGTSSRLQRDTLLFAGHSESASTIHTGSVHASLSCSSPPLCGTLRGTSSCVLEMLTADPPLLLDSGTTPLVPTIPIITNNNNNNNNNNTMITASSGSSSQTRRHRIHPQRNSQQQQQQQQGGGAGPFFLRCNNDNNVEDNDCVIADDSVVVEAGELCSPCVAGRQPTRLPSLTLPPDQISTSSGAGEFTSSPNKYHKTRGRRELHESSSKTSSRQHNSSLGGVTHSSVTRSQDSIEKGPMRVSLAHKALIGRGSFGVVFQAMDRDTNHIIAVKEIDFARGADSKCVEAVRKELALLKLLDHPHIVKCLGEECDESCLRIYLEYVSGGSIRSVMRTFGPFQEKQASIYTRQMLEGLAYLHSKNIMHRDLKCDNLLVDPNGTLKISDFGTAKSLFETNNQPGLAGTAYFMAPEVILAQEAGLTSDIWSVGCCVIEMLTGSPPFSTVANQYAMMMRVAKMEGELFPEMIPKDHKFSDKAISFLKRCLQRDPSKRPTTQELLYDPWILNPPKDTEHSGNTNNNTSTTTTTTTTNNNNNNTSIKKNNTSNSSLSIPTIDKNNNSISNSKTNNNSVSVSKTKNKINTIRHDGNKSLPTHAVNHGNSISISSNKHSPSTSNIVMTVPIRQEVRKTTTVLNEKSENKINNTIVSPRLPRRHGSSRHVSNERTSHRKSKSQFNNNNNSSSSSNNNNNNNNNNNQNINQQQQKKKVSARNLKPSGGGTTFHLRRSARDK